MELYDRGLMVHSEKRHPSRPCYRMGILRPGLKVMAAPTGEERPPRKGEWYLSGAEAEAYRAANDYVSAYHIARLVVVKETRTVTTRSWT